MVIKVFLFECNCLRKTKRHCNVAGMKKAPEGAFEAGVVVRYCTSTGGGISRAPGWS